MAKYGEERLKEDSEQVMVKLKRLEEKTKVFNEGHMGEEFFSPLVLLIVMLVLGCTSVSNTPQTDLSQSDESVNASGQSTDEDNTLFTDSSPADTEKSSVSGGPDEAGTEFCRKTVISDNTNKKRYLVIGNHAIAWSEETEYDQQIVVFDLSKNTRRTFYGSTINAYIYDNSLFLGLLSVNLDTDKQRDYVVSYPNPLSSPAVWEDIVVFAGSNSRLAYINMTELLTPADNCAHEIRYGFSPYHVSNPRMHNLTVVWTDSLDGSQNLSKVYYTRLNTSIEGEGVYITSLGSLRKCYFVEYQNVKEIASRNVEDPDVYSDMVVWSQKEDSYWQVHYFNITSGKSDFLAPSASNQIKPRISPSYVVWQDDRNSKWDIYAYDFNKKRVVRLSSSDDNQTSPVIFEDMVSWLEKNQVYLCTLG
jgi:beta propeller repeat protein